MRKNKKGFTLIELLVVIAIIGLLATIAVVALNTARRSSRDTKRIGDVKQVQTALELYYNAKSSYLTCAGDPVRISDLDGTISSGEGCTTADNKGGIELKNDYLSGMDNVKDPSSTTVCDSDCDGTNTCDYGYYDESGTSTYSIYFYLEAASGSLSAGCRRAQPSGII